MSRLRFLGASPAAVNRGGTTKWAGFNSIDNEVLLAALRFGWAPVALFLVGLAMVVGRVLVRRDNTAQITLTTLTPAYVTPSIFFKRSTCPHSTRVASVTEMVLLTSK